MRTRRRSFFEAASLVAAATVAAMISSALAGLKSEVAMGRGLQEYRCAGPAAQGTAAAPTGTIAARSPLLGGDSAKVLPPHPDKPWVEILLAIACDVGFLALTAQLLAASRHEA